MSTKYSRAFFMSGKDYKLTPFITLHHPTVEEIMELNDSPKPDNIYFYYVNIILSDPYSNMVVLDDMGINYMDITPFDVLIITWKKINEEYAKTKKVDEENNIFPTNPINIALNFFMQEDHVFAMGTYQEDGSPCLYDINNRSCQINREIYDYIYEWIKGINNVQFQNRINPADENARRILIEDMRDEIKKANRKNNKKKDDVDSFGGLLEGVSFGGNGVITPFNLMSSKVYWINAALSIDNKKSHASHLLDGLYHGTIRSKDIKNEELDWTK